MGFADANGSVVIAPQFDYAEPFKHGLALFTIEKGKKFGYVDEQGTIVWPASE